MLIYSIKNEKLSFFNRPIYCESFNEALSYIQNVLMSDADRALSGLRGDLALYYLGSIDFVSGVIDAPQEPMKVTDLQEIFDSIPSDRVPQTANELKKSIEDKYSVLSTLIDEVNKRVGDLQESIEDSVSQPVVDQMCNISSKKGVFKCLVNLFRRSSL